MTLADIRPAPRRRPEQPFRVDFLREVDETPRLLGYGLDVSETGLFVQCSNPREIGAEMRLLLHLPDAPLADEPIAGRGAVVWTRELQGRGGPPCGMGLRLADLGPGAQRSLRAFCSNGVVGTPPPAPERPGLDWRDPGQWRGWLERASLPPFSAPSVGPLVDRLRGWLHWAGRGALSDEDAAARALLSREPVPSRPPAAARAIPWAPTDARPDAREPRFRVRLLSTTTSVHRQFVIRAHSPGAAGALAQQAAGDAWLVTDVELIRSRGRRRH